MQTWITDKNFESSARNLDYKRLGAQIYEAIHILASNLEVNEKLYNPKRSVKNHPVSKLWCNHNGCLLYYISCHLNEYIIDRRYNSIINLENFIFLSSLIEMNHVIPEWVTDELIDTHRSVLISKKEDHYLRLWPDNKRDLKMRYDWLKETGYEKQ